ncbi:MAG: polymer-forming cytoskeletal protein [Phycisphaerales bacterium]|nr:polymer-forming cytoskeletal protein [Hyphomonadaceae bacterium]
MSETSARDLNGAMATARRTASHSVTMLKTAAGFGRGQGVAADLEPLEAANESRSEPDPSIISANTEMSGSIATSDELHVHGKIEGDVRATKIVVCAGGVIKGDLTADTIVIHGAVEGRIDGQHVVLCSGAVVKGEVTHSTLGIDTAAVFEGSVKRVAPAETANAAE